MLLNASSRACSACQRGMAVATPRVSGTTPAVPRRAARVVPRVASIERPLKVDRPTVDPVSEGWSTEEHVPGQIWTMHSPEQLKAAVEKHADQLTVLMCKSKTCRPCKMFMKKYMDIASRFPGAVLLQIFGDESPETRKLMVSMKVKVTPTFALYRGGAQVGAVTGVSDVKLLRAMVDAMTPQELEGHEEDVFELEAMEKEASAVEAAKEGKQ